MSLEIHHEEIEKFPYPRTALFGFALLRKTVDIVVEPYEESLQLEKHELVETHGFGTRHHRVQPACHVPSAAAPALDSVRVVWNGKDTGHLRMHVEHTVVDDAEARLCRVLSAAAYRAAHFDRVYGIPRGMVRLRHALDIHALAGHPADDRCAARPGTAHSPLPCHAADGAAQGYRLLRRGVVVCVLVAGGMAARLWRLARLVALFAVPPRLRHLSAHLCRMPSRMLNHPKPYFELAMWRYHNVVPVILLIGVVEALFSTKHVLEMVYYEEVMHYADHTYEELNQWSLIGIWAGCLFSLGWLKLMRWNVYKLIAVALFAFCLYAGGFYFLVDSSIAIEQLRLPLVWRGFSYAVLCIAFMWCLHEIMSFEHFFQALAVFNVLHMFVGGLVGASLHARGMKYYVGDGFARCSGYIDSVRMSARHADFPAMMESITQGFMAQSIKILFGWTLIAALFFAILMLLWDIPMVRRHVKHIPDWPKVGMGVLRGFHRQQRLKELLRQRRLSLV